MRTRIPALLTGAILLVTNFVSAQKIAEVVLWNGNHITGEVKSLQQGKLKFKTDHAGTIYIEWEFINSVTSTNFFEVETQLGDHYYGMLAPGPEEKKLTVIGPTETVILDMARVVTIMPIKQTFWGRIDGSLNFGFSFTSADSILQYSLESDATYRQPNYSARVKLNSIQTQQDTGDTFRQGLDFTYTRYYKNRYFGAGSLSFNRSSELGLDLRTQIGYVFGRSFTQNNRSRLAAGIGPAISRDTPIENPIENPIAEDSSDYALMAIIVGRYHFFLYNFPKTDFLIHLSVMPVITEWPRVRVEFAGSLKREIIKDFTVNLSVFDSYDSDPSSTTAVANHDFGIVLSVGWTF